MKWFYGLIVLAVLPIMLHPAFADIEKGRNYDRELLGSTADGLNAYKWTATSERILTPVGYQNYKITDDEKFLRFESALTAVQFNRNSCTFQVFDSGKITHGESPIINSVSDTLKQAEDGTDKWEKSNINDLQCEITYQTFDDKVQVTVKKSTLNQLLIGKEWKTVYDIDYRGKIKKTYLITNNDVLDSEYKYGFTESFDGGFIIRIGQTEYDTSNMQGEVVFTKNDLAGKTITITRNGFTVTYDTLDGVHDYLWALKIRANHMNIDYTFSKGAVGLGETLEIDPTFTSNNPSEDGNVSTNLATGAACPNGSFTKSTADASSSLYVSQSGAVDNCIRNYYVYDVSSIPNSAIVTNSSFKFEITGGANQRNCNYIGLPNDPTTRQAYQIWRMDFGNGTTMVSNDSKCATTGANKDVDLTSTGDTYIQNKLTSDYVAIGVMSTSEARDASDHSMTYCMEENACTPDPTLTITYLMPPANPPTNLAATSNARQVSFTWTASTPQSGNQNGVDAYFIGRSLDNSTWTNKTNVGNVTAYTSSAYWRAGLLYYVNITASITSSTGNSTADYDSFTMDDKPTAPLNPYTTGISDTSIKLNWSPPSSDGNDPITGYRIEYCVTCTAWTLLVNNTNTYNYNHTGITGSPTVKYRMGAWNGVALSPYTANFTGTPFLPTTGTVTITSDVVGDTIQANATVSITQASPSPVTVSQLKLYRNGTLVETKNVSVQIAQGGTSSNFAPFWNRMLTADVYSFKIYATVSNATGTVSIGSSNVTTTREYGPTYFNAVTDPITEGQVNYTVTRFDDEDGILLKVNREGGALAGTWEINCITQTNTEAAATRNQSLTWPGTWRNYSSVGYFNSTWTGLVNTHGYITCFNPPGILFTVTSYTNSSLALFGIEIFDNSYGAMLGVPVGIFFLAMAGSMANKRTAPTWIIVVLAMAGTMAAIGFFTLNPLVWGLALVTGLLGVLVNQKVF